MLRIAMNAHEQRHYDFIAVTGAVRLAWLRPYACLEFVQPSAACSRPHDRRRDADWL